MQAIDVWIVHTEVVRGKRRYSQLIQLRKDVTHSVYIFALVQSKKKGNSPNLRHLYVLTATLDNVCSHMRMAF